MDNQESNPKLDPFSSVTDLGLTTPEERERWKRDNWIRSEAPPILRLIADIERLEATNAILSDRGNKLAATLRRLEEGVRDLLRQFEND